MKKFSPFLLSQAWCERPLAQSPDLPHRALVTGTVVSSPKRWPTFWGFGTSYAFLQLIGTQSPGLFDSPKRCSGHYWLYFLPLEPCHQRSLLTFAKRSRQKVCLVFRFKRSVRPMAALNTSIQSHVNRKYEKTENNIFPFIFNALIKKVIHRDREKWFHINNPLCQIHSGIRF